MLFEQGKPKDYIDLRNFMPNSIITIKPKDQLYSSLPDYFLGCIKDFFLLESSKRAKNLPTCEQYLDLLHTKISHIRIFLEDGIINFSTSKNYYSAFKDKVR
jgi:hypothetical protein